MFAEDSPISALRNCKQAPGLFAPVIDRNRCEGKGPCITSCPYQVLAMYTVPKDVRMQLTLKGRIKGFFHDWQQAEVVRPDRCQACGLCVAACPESAITLARSP